LNVRRLWSAFWRESHAAILAAWLWALVPTSPAQCVPSNAPLFLVAAALMLACAASKRTDASRLTRLNELLAGFGCLVGAVVSLGRVGP